FPRASGLLLHPTSLPGGHGIGDFGPEAYRFVDFLAEARQRVWQILPLGPTGYGNSPYAALSAVAGNPLLLSLDRLADAGLIERHAVLQMLFAEQWGDVHRYARERDVALVGDIPIFVALDSADVWAHPDLFFLDEHGHPTIVAGVPPDYFSATGQRWGNPLY